MRRVPVELAQDAELGISRAAPPSVPATRRRPGSLHEGRGTAGTGFDEPEFIKAILDFAGSAASRRRGFGFALDADRLECGGELGPREALGQDGELWEVVD